MCLFLKVLDPSEMRSGRRHRATDGVWSFYRDSAFHQNVAVSPDYLIGTPEISGLLPMGRMK
jgi:hypothetical protein